MFIFFTCIKVCLKLNIQKTKIMASGPVSSVHFSHSAVSDSFNPMNRSMPGLPVHHQLSHPYMITRKTIITVKTFVGKVISLLFNTLSRFAIAFLPRNKHLIISWLQSPSVVILDPKKIKSVTVSIVSSSVCHEVMGPNAMILVF